MKFIASIQPFSKKCLLKNHWNQNSPLSKGKIFKQQTPFYMQATHLTDLDIQLISNYFDSLKNNYFGFGLKILSVFTCILIYIFIPSGRVIAFFCLILAMLFSKDMMGYILFFVFVVIIWGMSCFFICCISYALMFLFIPSGIPSGEINGFLEVNGFLGLIPTILFFKDLIADILNIPSNKEIELEKNEALRIILESNKKIILTDTIIANFTQSHPTLHGAHRDSYYFKVEKLGSLDSIREKISNVGSLAEGEKLYFHIVHYDFLNNKSRTGLFPNGHFIFKIETFDEQHDVSEIIGIGQVMNNNFIPESEWHN